MNTQEITIILLVVALGISICTTVYLIIKVYSLQRTTNDAISEARRTYELFDRTDQELVRCHKELEKRDNEFTMFKIKKSHEIKALEEAIKDKNKTINWARTELRYWRAWERKHNKELYEACILPRWNVWINPFAENKLEQEKHYDFMSKEDLIKYGD